ncbi:MAG TPA: metallophosphoesterase, partial [Gemmatimonadaceae bacterium]|nr:metallophosphoesterase [Gemmatimonadaceae bacterium]
MGPDVVRIAAVSDIHYSKNSPGALQPLFAEITESADVLVIAGDLTDYGLPEEAKVLARDLTTTVKIPIVAVLGNHDYESGEEAELVKILSDAGVKMLDGDTFETHGVGFAGVRGFCGGFGRGALGAWGEPIIKEFVHEAVNEALKLESALARLHTEHRIAILHYAPIRDTV